MKISKKKKACLAIILALSTSRKVNRKIREKEWLKKRKKHTHLNLLREISQTLAEDDYRNYYRMNETLFKKLLMMVTPHLIRQNTVMRESFSVEERLSCTLRFLATGRSYEDLKFLVIISPSAISQAIMETCETIVFALQDYMKVSPNENNAFIFLLIQTVYIYTVTFTFI
jgi:hypothetical protein